MNLASYPLATGSWTCSECEKPNLREAYPCELCYAVLCQECAEADHHEPTTDLICGDRTTVDSLPDDAT